MHRPCHFCSPVLYVWYTPARNLTEQCVPQRGLKDIPWIGTRRKCELQHDPRLLRLHKTSADGGITGRSDFAGSNHSDVDTDVSDNRFQAGGSGDGFRDADTAVRGGNDHTCDIGEVGCEVDNPGIRLLVTVISARSLAEL